MSCTITITGATLNPSTGNITVQGNFTTTTPCGALPTISITVQCGPNTFTGSGNQLPGTTLWQGTFPAPCSCDGQTTIGVVASCPGPPPFSCTATLTINNLCCCPQINTQVTLGSCTGNNQLATFFTSVVNNTACTFTVRRNFGNGFFGNVYTINPYSSQNLPPEQSSYPAPATYTSTVDVLSPPPLSACSGLNPLTFSVSCGSCYSTPLIGSICRFLEWLFLFSMTAGLSIGFSQPCIPIAVAAAFLGTGILTLAIYLLLQCQKCVCDFFLKYWGIILIATGFVNIMFIPPGCAAMTGFVAFTNTIILLTLGFTVLWLWYNNNKLTCPLIICDFWCAVSGILNTRSATNIAILVTFLIWGLTFPLLSAGFGLALFIIVSFAVFIWTSGPLSNPPCMHTPTCK